MMMSKEIVCPICKGEGKGCFVCEEKGKLQAPKRIRKNAEVYTRICLDLTKVGYSAREIMKILHFKSPQSVTYYLRGGRKG
jgi:hypothetical protein